ncbi:unnamed protein product, partial [Cyprideis torosa]
RERRMVNDAKKYELEDRATRGRRMVNDAKKYELEDRATRERRMVNDAKKYELEDRATREKIRARNQLESYVFNLKEKEQLKSLQSECGRIMTKMHQQPTGNESYGDGYPQTASINQGPEVEEVY